MDIHSTRQQLRTRTIYDLPLRVTFYARESSESDEQLNSLGNQIQYYRDLISRNPAWTFVDGYVDEGLSAATTKKRENFHRMIDDGKAGLFDLIITKEITRFARNTLDSIQYTRDLLSAGVAVFFQNDNINTLDEDSELRLTIMSGIAQDELRKLSSRVKFGHQQAIKNSVVLGNSRIFGYRKDGGRLVIDEDEAPMVRELFELYATGEHSMKQIETIFWDRGYRNHNGNRIAHTTMSGMISNPKYKGWYAGNKVKVMDIFTKKQKFLPPEEWVMYKDETGETVPAIVSEELWNKANEVFAERSMKVKATDRSAKKTSPLSGKIICGVHGVPFWRTSYSKELHRGAPIYEWVCREKKKGKSADCPTIAIYESELYKILGSMFIDLSGNIDRYIEEFIALYEDEQEDTVSARELDALQREIEALEIKKDKLLDLYTDDAITKTEFKKRNEALGTEITKLKTRITDTQRDTRDKAETIRGVKDIRRAFTNDLAVSGGELDRQTINDLSDMLIDKIVVYPNEANKMKLDIFLKLGIREARDYAGSLRPRFGTIDKKMIESYQNTAK